MAVSGTRGRARVCSFLTLCAGNRQTELLSLWDKPCHTVTTTMLWNAVSDDAPIRAATVDHVSSQMTS